MSEGGGETVVVFIQTRATGVINRCYRLTRREASKKDMKAREQSKKTSNSKEREGRRRCLLI